MAPDWTAYTDGGCKDELAGWGYVLTEGGDGVEDVQARVLDEGYGPVVVEEGHIPFSILPHGLLERGVRVVVATAL